MSLQGQLLRGAKWHKYRDVDGNYHKDVASDPHKMEEVKFYIDFLKGKDENKVYKLLEKLHFLDLSNKPKLMDLKAKELHGDFKPPKKEEAKEAPKKKENK